MPNIVSLKNNSTCAILTRFFQRQSQKRLDMLANRYYSTLRLENFNMGGEDGIFVSARKGRLKPGG
jgi:hypothetical protein